MLANRASFAANSALFINSAVDPYVSSVVMLLHGEGTNGASTAASFVDNGQYAVVPSNVTNTTISTARSKFGSASILMSAGYLRYAANTGFDVSAGDFTIEGWFYFTTTALQRLVQHQTGSSNNSQYTYCIQYLADGTVRGCLNGGSTIFAAPGPSAPALNTWHHIAFVKYKSALSLYINGVPGATVAGPASPNSLPTATLVLGADLDGSGTFTGNMDEVRITKGVARYTQKFTVPTTAFPNYMTALGTVLGTENFIFAGDNTNGSTVITDSSSNALTVDNTAGVTNSTSLFTRGTGSLSLGNQYFFTGTTTKAYMGGASDWTFDCFIYLPTQPTTYQQIYFCSLGIGGGGWNNSHMCDLTVSSTRVMNLEWCIGSTSTSTSLAGNAIPLTTWQHIALTWDSTAKQFKMYQDGTLTATIAASSFTSYGSAPRVTIGRTDPTVTNSSFFYLSNMYLDRIRLTPSIRWTTNFTPD